MTDSQVETQALTGTADSRSERERLMKAATYASVSVAVTLIAAKFAAWIATDSVSLLSTLVDSLLDAGASVINLIAVRHALQPADAEHRFGHGKAEALAALSQAAFICGSAAFLLLQAGERLFNPQAVTHPLVGYWVMGFSIVMTLGLVAFQRHVVRKTGSLAIRGDSIHYRMDLLVNAGVIVSLFLATGLGWNLADPVFAIGIVAYIFWGASEIGKTALNMLMDRELPDADRNRIRDIAREHPDVRDVHDLKTRTSGTRSFIQMHLEMDGAITLDAAHEISEAVMHEIEREFPDSEVLIHEDPEGVEERREYFD